MLGAGIVLCAIGAKLALIHRYGTDQPYLDQWAAEGMYLLRGPLYYNVDFPQMISLHAEHRPGLTRLWVRGLIFANGGQWDCFVELVANLLIYAAFLAVAWHRLARLAAGRWPGVLAVLMAGLFALPCAYENFLWGFQSCFLFMLLAGLLHVTGTLQAARPAAGWWLAHLAGLAGLFSIAAGPMSAAALLGVAGWELVRGRRDAWVWATLSANALLFGLGVWLVPAGLGAAGSWSTHFGQVVTGMLQLLSWPQSGPWWCLFLQAPGVFLLGAVWRNQDPSGAGADRVIGATGLWVAAIACSMAFGRALNSSNIGVRYYDVLLVGLFINLLALFRLGPRLAGGRRLLWAGLGVAWLLVVATGLGRRNQPGDLGPLLQSQYELAITQRELVRDFLRTSDPARLQEFARTSHRFPHFQITVDFLRDPKVPPLLPPSLTPDGRAGPLSRLAVQVAAGWPWILAAGMLLMLAGVLRSVRPSPRATAA